LLAAGCAALLAALFFGLGERFLTTLARLLDPTADIPPATWLQLRSPGDLDVLEGEPLAIEGKVVRSTVDEVDLVLFDATGRTSRQPMRAVEAGLFSASLEGLDHPVRYRLEGGNTWTKTHAIRILKRPEIRSLVRRVRLPDYMRIDASLPVESDAVQVKAPEGSTVEFEAVASAEAAEGSLKLFTRTLEERVAERFDERVWFEDDLPRDAAVEAAWKWTTSHAAGGLRSFAVSADGRTATLRTRLEPLVLPKERLDTRSLMVMARLDPAEPPTRLAVLLEHKGGRLEVVWGDTAGAPPVQGAARVPGGPLPEPGTWARLMVPIKSLGNLAGQPISGASFSVDRGRALVDRPGWVERGEEVISQPVDHPTGSIPLARITASSPDTEAARADGFPWLGGVPVEKPTWATIEFVSAQGHASLPVPPLEILPTVDGPPTIVMDKIPETLTLKVADDVPVRGTGFDDWGIDSVGVLVGPDPEHLADPVPLPGLSLADRPPDVQVSIATALSPELLGIGPGKSAAWKLRIRDTKGQTADTKVFRVVVVMPPESELAKSQVPALLQAKKEADALAKEAEKKAEPTDAKQEAVQQALAKDQEPEKKNVDEVAQRLEAEQRLAEQLTKTVEKAAEQAAQSSLVPEAQKEELAKLAAEAKALEQQIKGEKPATPPDAPANPADAKPEAAPEAAAAKPEQTPAEMAQAEKAERVAEAPSQKEVADRAEELAAALEEVEQRLNAEGAALQLDALAKDLDRRADELAALPPAQEQSREQQAQARQQLREVEQILGQRFPEPKPQSKPAADMTAAADSTGENQPTPNESGQPEKASQPDAAKNPEQAQKPFAQAANPQPQPPDAKPQPTTPAAPSNPLDTPPASQQADAAKTPPENTPAADSQSPDAQAQSPDAASDGSQEPAGSEPASAAEAAAETAANMAEAVAELAAQLSGKAPIPPAENQAAAPADAPAPAKGSEPAADAHQPANSPEPAATPKPGSSDPAGSPTLPAASPTDQAAEGQGSMPADESAGSDFQSLLESRDVQQALAMAERSRRLQERAAAAAARAAAAGQQGKDGRQPGQQPGDTAADATASEPTDDTTADDQKRKPKGRSDGGTDAGRADGEAAEVLRGLDARQRAALYKLPPRLREPLLEGMRQRGPAAYQDVIDTYFRQLGKDIPQ
ncbi:MAG: hypothetical protein ACKOTB_17870, partial [Planctomycetia bacterium]